MKNYLASILVCAAIFMPAVVAAQYEVPTNSFGIATQASVPEAFSAIISFLASILAVLCILIIVISGIMYMVSNGDSTKIEQAKTMLTYAIVGLVIALLAWVIVRAISTAFGIT